MALKDIWKNKVDGVDDIDASDINVVAEAVIKIEKEMEEGGGTGEDGATFIPYVSEDGVLSWSNNKGLVNPEPINLVQGVIEALPLYSDEVKSYD